MLLAMIVFIVFNVWWLLMLQSDNHTIPSYFPAHISSTQDPPVSTPVQLHTNDPITSSHRSHNLIANNISSTLSEKDHLIIVAGHAVFQGNDYTVMDKENDWLLLDYQKGQLETMLGHLRVGLRLLAEDPQSLLLFSGGQTRATAGHRSEGSVCRFPWKNNMSNDVCNYIAFSYWMYAQTHGYILPVDEERVQLEEYALDSFENVLFSLCRFQELTGRYPRNVTVVSYNFKRARFLQLHRAALKFPEESFRFIGLDPPFTFVEVRPPLPGLGNAASNNFIMDEDMQQGSNEERLDEEKREEPFSKDPVSEENHTLSQEQLSPPSDTLSKPKDEDDKSSTHLKKRHVSAANEEEHVEGRVRSSVSSSGHVNVEDVPTIQSNGI
jgi:hypothetical protein